MASRALAFTLLAVLMLVWGTTFIVTKSVLTETTPLMLAWLRFLCASVVLLPIALIRGGLKALPRPFPFGRILLMSLTGFVFYFVAFNYALVYTSAVQGALIQALLPAGVAIGAAVFLRERPTVRRLLGIALSVLGIIVLVANGRADHSARNPLLGDLLMVSTVVVWAIYTVVAKGLARSDQIVVTACNMTLAAILLIPLVLLDLHGRPFPALSPDSWIKIVYLGLLASGAAFVVYNLALRELEASTVGVWMNLVPLVGMFAAVLFLGESLNSWQILGAAVALIGMWLSS